jgi:Lrp/AsnC family leucine-responsive transcriptional regulator
LSREPRKPRPLDRTDRLILRYLQEDGRIANVALAKKVNLTPTPCLERVRRLERDGYIKGYTALLEPGMVGAG